MVRLRLRVFVFGLLAVAYGLLALGVHRGASWEAPRPVAGTWGVLVALVLLGGVAEAFPIWWSVRTSTAWQLQELATVPAAVLLPVDQAVAVVALGGVVGLAVWLRSAAGARWLDRAAYRLAQPVLSFVPVLVAVHLAGDRPGSLLLAGIAGAVLASLLSTALTVVVLRVAQQPGPSSASDWRAAAVVPVLSGALGTVVAFAAPTAPVAVLGVIGAGVLVLSRTMERAYLAADALTGLLGSAQTFHLVGDRHELERAVDTTTRQLVGASARLGEEGEPTVVVDLGAPGNTSFRRIQAPILDGVTALVETALTNLELRQRAEHLAEHDELTDLPNRRFAVRHLRDALERAERRGSGVGVVFVDVDGLKAVNDTEGHAAGDRFIRSVADALRAACRSGEVAGRLGGDEFVVVVESRDAPRACREVADRLGAELRRGGLSASLGAAVHPADGSEPGELLRVADQRMYLAKQRARGHRRRSGAPDRRFA